ncbi:putative methyltransferase-domain-containing protein [Irpex rosettiformis]|uniref:Methyltransferase-domain-containing protein n=1 Tax=Irpex rosettiformis TaxID=378272 RepID=A0ACB8UG49_9APHY|nr:putative methyltransferase-domain-containing protein [Irpex rosettiformis]
MEIDMSQSISRGPCRLPPGSDLVTDADEEVFLLYTSLAAKNTQSTGDGFRGLGYLDNHKDVLTLEFTVPLPQKKSEARNTSRKRKAYKSRGDVENLQKTLEVQLAQDKTALRSRKGDTGSVLWRASAEFAQFALKESVSTSPTALLDQERLAEAHVLELGYLRAGTALLAIVLSSLVRQYTVTDIEDLIPLITKNLSLNNLPLSSSAPQASSHKVTAEALDWVLLKNSPPSVRQTAFSYPQIDLLLVVDCIYHPSLLRPLVETINYLATPERTAVLVLVELRQEDVVREFLELWLLAGEGAWEIWHVESGMEGPYAMWIGWKKAIKSP